MYTPFYIVEPNSTATFVADSTAKVLSATFNSPSFIFAP